MISELLTLISAFGKERDTWSCFKRIPSTIDHDTERCIFVARLVFIRIGCTTIKIAQQALGEMDPTVIKTHPRMMQGWCP